MTWDGERRRANDPIIDTIQRDIKEIKRSVGSLSETINGNGKEGIKISIDRNTQFRFTITKLLWGLFTPVYVGLIALLLKTFAGK